MKRPILTKKDTDTFVKMLEEHRAKYLDKWRMGVRSEDKAFDKAGALSVLAEEMVKHEAITASKADITKLMGDTSDYGGTVGIGVSADMLPEEAITVSVFVKMVTEVLRLDQTTMDHLRKTIKDRDRTLATWVRFFLSTLEMKAADELCDDPIVISGAAFREFETWQIRREEMEDE